MTSFGGAQADDLIGDNETPATVYDALKDALSDKVQRPPLTLNVPGRPTITMRFNPDIEFELYQKWINAATKGKRARETGEIDHLRLALTVISYTNVAVLVNGKEVSGSDGALMTVKSTRVHEMLKVPTGAVGGAIRKMYGSDGHAIQTMKRIIEAAGYSIDGDVEEEGEEEGPLDLLSDES